MKRLGSIRTAGQSFVHVGTHKTGTTAFQHYMCLNAEHFRSRGLSYYVHESGSPQAHELPLIALRPDLTIPIRATRPDGTLAEAKVSMHSAVGKFLDSSKDQVTFFSHEALSFVRESGEAKRLKALLGKRRDTRILLVLRDESDFLESWKRQLRKMDFSDSSQFQSSFMYTEPDSWLVDYDALVAAYTDVFGSQNVTVLSYEQEMARFGSIVPALLLACGYDLNTLPSGWDALRNQRDSEH